MCGVYVHMFTIYRRWLDPPKKKEEEEEEAKNVILKDRDRHHKHGNKTLLNVNYST